MASIPITRPFFDGSERELILETLDSGWLVQGPKVAAFEELFGVFTGSAHSVATSSCTTALHLALVALGIGEGDEVIVPAFTWIATANVVEYVKARPVFCDIDLETYNIDVGQIESLLTPRTKAIIPVHLFGLCADMDPLLGIARERGLRVIEDAACALGGRYGDRHAGTLGNIGCFSFHPRKSVTTGEGGMLTTQCQEWADLARVLRDHGGSVSDRMRHESGSGFVLPEFSCLGYNYRMTDLQGALGCAQMRKANDIIAARRRRAVCYDHRLKELAWLRTPAVPKNCTHAFQAYVGLFAPESPTERNLVELHQRRNLLMNALAMAGVSTRPGTHAVHVQTYYAQKYGLKPWDFPNAYVADRLTLALPLFPQMSDEEQDRVVDALGKEYAQCVA